MKEYQKFALDFTTALVEKKFEEAHQFLAAELKREYSPNELKEEMFEMFDVYEWDTEPHKVVLVPEGSMEEWPDRKENEIGWVYVGIEGEGASEAVIATIAKTEAGLKVSHIEWGRP